MLAWQTGYAENVDLASGHPELVTATQSLPAGEGVDVSLCIEGAGGELGDGVTRDRACQPARCKESEVSIRTAAAGRRVHRHRAPARRRPADVAGAAARRRADGRGAARAAARARLER